MAALAEELLEREKRLLDPMLRRNSQRLAFLLADDFVEFGSTGCVHD